jgi:heme exporter protein B
MRDLQLAVRRWDQVLQPLVFFAMVTTLFPLATSPELAELRRIGPGVIWVAAMLASLLALESLFKADVEDGTLEQWTLSGQPLAWMLLAKTTAHWILSALPLVLISPVLAVVLGLEGRAWRTLMVSLIVGTIALNVIGAIGAALTVGIRRGNVLLALLVLPLAMPILIFGARAVELAGFGESAGGPLKLLAALAVLGISLGPIAIAAAIRIGVES